MRTSRFLVCLAAGALVLAACGSSHPSSQSTGKTGKATTTTRVVTTTTTAPLARGTQAPRSSIPWNQVGPGWALAVWTSSTPTSADGPLTTVPGQLDSLFLVNPDGGRYLVTTLPSSSTLSLTAWSGDGMRALLTGPSGSGDSGGTQFTEVNLKSGSQHSFTLPDSYTAAYSNPQGLAILATTEMSPKLERLSTSGTLQLTFPATFSGLGAFNGLSASSPDGTQIAMGTEGAGIALVGNNGSVLAHLPVPGTSYCSPVRWWTDTEVLVSCTSNSPNGGEPLLWLLPTSGGAPIAFTVLPPSGSADDGDEVAWQVGSNVYLQDAGGCGYQYLAELQPDHTTAPVTVPGVTDGDSQFVLGTVGEQIGLEITISCGPGLSLVWFDAQTGQVNVVLGPGINGGSVVGAVLFGDNNGGLR